MEKLRLGIFDVNGTLRERDQPIQISTLDGINNIHSRGMRTTVVSGRGYRRLAVLLGNQLNEITSPGLPMGVEYGGRIISRDGKKNEDYSPIPEDALINILGDPENIHFAVYFPEVPTADAVLWTPPTNKANVPELEDKYGYFAKVTTDPFATFMQRLIDERPCMVAIKTRDPQYYVHFPFQNITAIENSPDTFAIVSSNKGQAVRIISQLTDIPLEEILIIGNDVADIPMLNLPARKKLIVGGRIQLPGVESIPSTEAVGAYLQQLSL